MVYVLPYDSLGWLWPLLQIGGAFLEGLALFIRWRPLLLAGLGLAILGSIPESDLTFALGASAAALGIYAYLPRKRP